ncbi:MAG: SDR family oxidoreductase, partial [Pirellulaceae bacterium]
VDVGDRESARQLVEWATESLGQVDILVNAAGVNINNRTMEAMTPEDWDDVLRINATGGYNLMYYVLPQMRTRKDGLIINISSIAGKRALTLGGIAYCASKFAMTALGTAAGNEVAKDGVRVTSIYPGEVDTPLLDRRPVKVTQQHRDRILKPEDFSELVVAICHLPPRAHVPEIVVKPTLQEYV